MHNLQPKELVRFWRFRPSSEPTNRGLRLHTETTNPGGLECNRRIWHVWSISWISLVWKFIFACLFASNFIFELAQCCSASCEKSVGQKQWRHTLNITTRKPESITDMSMYIVYHFSCSCGWLWSITWCILMPCLYLPMQQDFAFGSSDLPILALGQRSIPNFLSLKFQPSASTKEGNVLERIHHHTE